MWDKFPELWASIVVISQILHIAKPYIPFIKNYREFNEMSLLYDSLYLLYEKLWFDYRKTNKDSKQIEKAFYSLRRKEHEISKRFKHIICPIMKGMIKESDNETDIILKTNYF